MNRIALLGATGSIGTSSLNVIAAHSDQMTLAACSCHGRWEELAEISSRFSPQTAIITKETSKAEVDCSCFPNQTDVQFGEAAIAAIAADPEIDTVISAIVGAAGLRGSWAAVEAGKRLAVANKETLVLAGPLVMQKAAETNAELIPIDSEHSAIFQALQSGQKKEVQRVILTASGGPFLNYTKQQMESVTPEMALDHPTWDMGPKITIDSATMLNKAMEIIEARWLFGLEIDQIEVVIHPQSVIHSMVEFVDGSVMAQLSPPDMKLPIQYALTYPERSEGISPRMDFSQACNLELIPPDFDLFPALKLGFEVAERGGTCGAVLNAAKEVAVDRFLNHEIPFLSITQLCKEILESHTYKETPTIDEILAMDIWAREQSLKWG